MNINSIEELKQLAGLLKTDPVSTTMPITVDTGESSCGCGDATDMRKYMDSIPVTDIKVEEDDLEEWANSTEHFDGEPRVMDQPRGEIVDISLRRKLNAKGDHVTIDESKVDEGIKDKLKVLALLGLTGMGAMQALQSTSATNSPLGQAMQQAAESGDEYAAEQLKNLDGYVEVNSPMLRTLNQMYIQEQHTPEKMVESYKKFKNKDEKEIKEETEPTDKKDDKKDDKDDKDDESVVVSVKDIKENKIVRKKFRDQKTFENWKNSPKSSGYIIQENKKIMESIDLTQLKKNAGIL